MDQPSFEDFTNVIQLAKLNHNDIIMSIDDFFKTKHNTFLEKAHNLYELQSRKAADYTIITIIGNVTAASKKHILKLKERNHSYAQTIKDIKLKKHQTNKELLSFDKVYNDIMNYDIEANPMKQKEIIEDLLMKTNPNEAYHIIHFIENGSFHPIEE